MRRERWDAARVADQGGRVVVVTGATSGIGKEAARVLAGKNATVILAVRNIAKGEEVRREFVAESGGADVSVLELDLARLRSVRRFAEGFADAHDRLDVLINNAGVMFGPYRRTEDGFERQMGTNHLGHFALTGLLFPLLEATPGSRVVNVSSGYHAMGRIDFDDLHWERRRYRPGRAYGDTKLANLYFTYELARRMGGRAPMATAAHPGWATTGIQKNAPIFRLLSPAFAQSAAMGALPTLRAGFDPGAEPAAYYGPGGFMTSRGHPVRQRSNPLSHDEGNARRLWALSEEMTGVRFTP